MRIKKYFEQNNDRIAGKLMSYAGMSGAFLAAAGQAEGQVVYTDVDPDIVVQGTTMTIDMDNDLTPDYSLQQFGTFGQNIGAKFSAPSVALSNEFMGSVGAFSYYYPSKLSAGAAINGSNTNWLAMGNAPGYEPSLVFAYATGAIYGQWSQQSGYVGVHFLSGGNDYYGWVELDVDSLGSAITLKGYAYEMTPATGIIAGDTGVTGINDPDGRPISLDAGRIMPNPVSNGKAGIHIEALKAEDIELEIYDGMGQRVSSLRRYVKPGRNLVPLEFPTLGSGSYFLKISDGSASIFRKLVIAR